MLALPGPMLPMPSAAIPSSRSGGGAPGPSPGPQCDPAGSAWVRICGACGRRHDLASWRALPVVASYPRPVVQQHLAVPASFDVEVRRCTCDATLAASVAGPEQGARTTP